MEKLTIESKDTIEEYTKNRFEICDLSFSNLFLWSFGENTEYEIENDVLTIRSEYMGEAYYYMPILNDTPENITAMKEKIKNIIEENVPIHYFTEYWYEKLKDVFKFYKRKRDYEDYIYSYESLFNLRVDIMLRKKIE